MTGAVAGHPKMYRAIVQVGFNAEDPDSTLKLVSKPIPQPAPGRVLVRMTVRPVNPSDLLTIRTPEFNGSYAHTFTPGCEGFGIVEAIGEGVTSVKAGQRVVAASWLDKAGGNGSWQEYVCMKEELIIPIPDTISDEIASQLLINPWSVISMLRDQDVPKGEYLIQTAAGSVLGRQLIQIAKHKGIKTINIVRRPELMEELLALGADEVICSKTEDIVARVKEITSGKLAFGAVDSVAGDLTKTIAASVRNKGQLFVIGFMASFDISVAILDLFRGVQIIGWNGLSKFSAPQRRKELAEETIKLLEEKVFEPLIGEKFDLADFKKAIERGDSVARGGKVLLTSY